MNTRMVRVLLGVFFVLSCFSLFSQTRVDSTLLYVFPDYNPACFINADGKPDGFFVEILVEVFEKRLKIPIKMEMYPWARCQFMVETGDADLITTIPTQERLAWSEKTDTYIWVKQNYMYTWAKNPQIPKLNEVKSLKDLKNGGYSVITYRGHSWAESVLGQIKIPLILANTVDSSFLMLSARRGDVIIEDPILIEPALRRLGLSNSVILTQGHIDEQFFLNGFYVLIGKKSSYAWLQKDISVTLDAMWKDGTIENILYKYRIQ